jgi:hypothetical protein
MFMDKTRHNTRRRSLTEYRQAEPIEPNPVRRLTTFLVATGITVSLLVIADAIEYFQLRADPEAIGPITLALYDEEGNLEDETRGEQKIKKDEEEPKTEQPEDEPTPDPPVRVEVKNVEPETHDGAGGTSDKAPVIGRGAEGQARVSGYANRSGDAKKAALGKYGGDARTQNAVRLGLDWLARHQDEDGKWSRTHFHKHCRKGDRCGGPGQFTVPLDPGLTGLALLCFCADNHTHRRGEYKDRVARAVKYLCDIQTETGHFGAFPRNVNQYMMYNQGIATFALAELCALSGDLRLQRPVEKAVGFIVRAQQPSGAWDYTDVKTGRYDTSVTGWQVMALKSAQAAGVEVPSYTLYKMAWFLNRVTLANGEVIYANAHPGPGRRGQGMVAVGMASNQFLGLPARSPVASRQAAILLQHPPGWKKIQNPTSFDSIYYWYYATIAMFQYSGDEWDRWNARMKRTLLLHQRRGGCQNGSWDPPRNFWGKIGGRLYATTLNILNLEIYYRYLPLYSGGSLKTVDALIDIIETRGRVHGVQAVRLLGRFEDETARNYLIKLAHAEEPKLAMSASVALAGRKDAAAVAPLLKQLESTNAFRRYQALRALQPMMGRGLVPVYINALRDEKAMVARQAAQALRQYASQSFGFEPEAGEAEREGAIEKWKAWWAAREKGEAAPESTGPWMVLSVRADKGLVAFTTSRPDATENGKRLSVFRDDQYIGRINVVQVKGEICIGRVLDQYTGGEIKEGDVVRPGS